MRPPGKRRLGGDDGRDAVVISAFSRALRGSRPRLEDLYELALDAGCILGVDVGHGRRESRKGQNVPLGKFGIGHVARHVHVHGGRPRHGGHAAQGVEHGREFAPACVLRDEHGRLREVGVLGEGVARSREELQVRKLGMMKEPLDRQRGRGFDLHLMANERD